MPAVKLPQPLRVRDRDFEVWVTEQGRFLAEMDGKKYSEDTLETLKATLSTATRKKITKVSVRFSALQRYSGGWRVEHGEGTGIHAANGNTLIRWANGETEQVDYSFSRVLRRLNEEETAEWARLQRASDDATAALREFERARSFRGGLREAVRRAVNEAINS